MEHYRPISMALKYPAIKFNSSPSAQRHSYVCVMAKDMFEEEKRSILEPAGALALAGAEAYCKYYGLKGENVVATTSGATMNFDRLRLVTELAGVGRKREAVLATYMPEEPKGAGTSKGERLKGEGEDDVTVQHERKYEAGTSKGKERIEGEGEDDVAAQYAGELEDKLTGSMSLEYLYNLAYPEMQAMSAEYSYNFAWNSASEKRKYEAGTSKGKERIEGEGEDDVSAQYMYAVGSVVKEPLKDVDLLFSLSSQPPNFALSQRAEEREHNFALPQRAEEREHNFALSQRVEGKENKNWVGGLALVVPHVITFGMCAATFIGVCLLNNNSGKKVDDLASQFKAVNEAWVAAGCPPPTVCVLNPSITISSLFALFNFGNPSTTVSTPVGLFNRGNPSTTVSPLLGLININIGK